MSSRSGSTTRELLRLYSLASPGEYNLAQFLAEQPELVAHIGVPLDLERDDAGVALQLAPAVGRYKKRAAHLDAGGRAERAAAAARRLVATARPRADWLELDVDVLLGDLLAHNKKYIAFEIPGARVSVLRCALARARAPLRSFIDRAAYIDESGLHIRWRGGQGGLNFRPQVEERGAEVLHVDFRPAPPARVRLSRPVLLGDVLADLGFT